MSLANDRVANIAELEQLAAEIIELKKENIPRRPIVIEFCGSPKAGKTSCINALAMFMRRNGIRTSVFSERGAVSPIRNKFDPNFNVWAGCSTLMQFSEIMANDPTEFDLIIMDRGFFDAICWFEWLKKLKKLNEDHYERFFKFFFSPRWLSKLTLVYVFSVDPEEALRREHSNLLTDKRGTIMNKEVLDSIKETVDFCTRQHHVFFGNKLRRIDTTENSLSDTSYRVTKETLTFLKEALHEKIAYFDKKDIIDSEEEVLSLTDVVKVREFNYSNRSGVEEIEGYCQPIPVAIITDPDAKNIVVGRKLVSSTSAESPERGKDLIYFGGHVRQEDTLTEYGNNGPSSVMSATLSRELKEELNIDYDASGSEPLFCISEYAGGQRKRHVAVVYHIRIDYLSMKLAADGREFSNRGVRIARLSESQMAKLNLESWGTKILQEYLSKFVK